MKLNHSKCKDMIISFAKDQPNLDPIFVENHELAPVFSAKILGTYISADLKWNTHIAYIVLKASKRLYFLRLLKQSGLDHASLLTQYLPDDVERVQRRALRIIYPDLSYRMALDISSLPQRRDELCRSHFKKIIKPSHKLNYLLPEKRSNNLRNNENLTHIWSCTNRFKNSFLPCIF